MCIFQKTPLYTPPRRPLSGLTLASQKGGGCPGERVPQPGEPGPAEPSPAGPGPHGPRRRLNPFAAPAQRARRRAVRPRAGGPGGRTRGFARCLKRACGGPSSPARRAWVPLRKASRCVVPSSPTSDSSNRLRKSPDNKQASEQINDSSNNNNNNNKSPISLVAWEKVRKAGLPGSGVGANGSSGSHSRGNRPGRLS